MFDNTGKLISDAEISRSDKIEMYRKRRENAVALWATIPDEQFDIGNWKCGTTCCAIGWLCEKQHDGWTFFSYIDEPWHVAPTWSDLDPWVDIEKYFGLSKDQSEICFLCYHKNLDSVSKELLAAPYVFNE